MSGTVGASRIASSGARRRRDVTLWLSWGLVITLSVAYVIWSLHVLLDFPRELTPWWLLGALAMPISWFAISSRSLRLRAGTVLAHTVVVVGLLALILFIYLVVVVGLGQDIDGAEHRVLGLSMLAAVVSVVLAGPLRRRLTNATAAWTEPGAKKSSAAIETFGTRMTRAVPMDELLLQLAETLHESMATTRAEVWVGESGWLERKVSVPDRGPGRVHLVGPELSAVSVARVSGTAWGNMWVPDILAGVDETTQDARVAPITHLGKLLGLLLVVRDTSEGPFAPSDEVVLADLARTLGLALHNVGLDTALQQSLDELSRRNAELQASRARIVSAADESRRMIERNLHDGAQQHLVALAVKVRLLSMKFGSDEPVLADALSELQDDIQTTVDEVRELAHGIYPPLLRDRGLEEALQNAASRSPLPVRVVATSMRFSPEMEAAVYFCCLEAMQNAAKYAGESARVDVRVAAEDDLLVFEITDDGVGFDFASVAQSQGFVNMQDRVGAHGGELTVDSRIGHGTKVVGQIPVTPSAG